MIIKSEKLLLAIIVIQFIIILGLISPILFQEEIKEITIEEKASKCKILYNVNFSVNFNTTDNQLPNEDLTSFRFSDYEIQSYFVLFIESIKINSPYFFNFYNFSDIIFAKSNSELLQLHECYYYSLLYQPNEVILVVSIPNFLL